MSDQVGNQNVGFLTTRLIFVSNDTETGAKVHSRRWKVIFSCLKASVKYPIFKAVVSAVVPGLFKLCRYCFT